MKGEPEGVGEDTGYPPPDPGEGEDPNAGLTQDDIDPNTQVRVPPCSGSETFCRSSGFRTF